MLTLQPPTKTTAIAWLRNQGWGEDQVSSIEGYLEPSSLALRPFFLKTLSDPGVARMVESTASTSVLSILMEAMVEREIGKFGEQIDRVLTEDDRRLFIHSLLGEVARDMAESATSSISDATLAWMVEVALPKEVPDDVKRILKARIQALAFFANDDRKGYRRFFHEKFFEYFLANSIIELISNGESGKILSRTIFGSSLLETFCDIISVGEGKKGRAEFINSAINIIDSYPPIDRTRKNVAALAVSSLAVVDSVGDVCICDVDIDEARFFGTAAPAGVKNAVINQFDCRGGNISSINFENVSILTLIADGETLLPDDFPLPTRIRDLTRSGETLFSPEEVKVWVLSHLENPPHHEKSLIPAELKDHPAIKLLHRACRLRQYWLRRGDDMYASRILDDANWQIIEEILNSNNLLRVEIRQASGNDARFIHIRMTDQILQEDSGEPDIKNMYEALVEKLKT
ncbi:MAG: hypothetical protein K0M60_06605 [Hydrogenophaga sp.]|nr:hypothetical protein [Hydrogenophaga sp.]